MKQNAYKESVKLMNKTTFAIIGAGIVGERIINQILSHPNCEIIGVFDENEKRLSEMKHTYGLKAMSSINELLELKPNWVYIGTPPNRHAEISELAALHGCHVLSEKPLAHDVKAGEKMVEATTQAQVQTAMHFPLMYSDAVQTMMHAIKSDSLGDILRIELHTYFPHWPRKWQQNPWIGSREQGGFIREVFPHYFQIMYRLFNHFTIFSHQTIYPIDKSKSETSTVAIGFTDTDIPILINGISGIGQQESLAFTVYGSKKVMTLKNWSELWVSEIDEEAVRVMPDVKTTTLFDECHAVTQGEDAKLVSFEEGLIIQRWIDQLLTESGKL